MIQLAIQAALEAGEAILDIYDQDFEVEYKSDESPLTAADKAAHNIIVHALETTPYPVLSEESAKVAYDDRKDWSTYWLVDPLDGTKEFIKKNGEFTVNIALIEEGVPVLGIVYVPVLDTLYCGMLHVECEMPAWKANECTGKSIAEIMASAEPLSTSNFPHSTGQRALRVVASKSHCNDETRQFITDLEKGHGAAELVSSGSSLKLCMVAEGSADIYPRIAPTMEWDTAAAHAVVVAAGGAVFQYDESLPVAAYSVSDSEREKPVSLRYNKENLLNPYFVVSGLNE
jgi:3'(2'), 5'-bisphosphate nucleotidase